MSLAAEKTILGASIIANESIGSVIEALKVEDFSSAANRAIFSSMRRLFESGKGIDLVTIRNDIDKETLDSIGGIVYLSSLVEGVPRLENLDSWCEIVKEASTIRKLATAAQKIGDWCADGSETSKEILDRAESAIFAIAEGRSKDAPSLISAGMKEAIAEIERVHEAKGRITGVSSGLKGLDDYTDGFKAGQLIILAARPAVGKSALAMGIARSVADSTPVLTFSLEMSKSELLQRMIYTESKIDSRAVRRGQLKDRDWGKMSEAAGKLNNLPLIIDDASYLSPLEIRSKARRIKAEHGLGLIVVDYLGLVTPSDRRENTNADISVITRSLKGLAKELEVPVVCLSQLSRGTERRESHRPQLSDLRDSGSIEQDADVVLFIYRECMYNPSEDNQDKAEIIVAKQRSGPTGIVPVRFTREWTAFSDPISESF